MPNIKRIIGVANINDVKQVEVVGPDDSMCVRIDLSDDNCLFIPMMVVEKAALSLMSRKRQ